MNIRLEDLIPDIMGAGARDDFDDVEESKGVEEPSNEDEEKEVAYVEAEPTLELEDPDEETEEFDSCEAERRDGLTGELGAVGAM